MTPEQILKQQIKKLIDEISPFTKNAKIINAVTRFVIEDRQKREE